MTELLPVRLIPARGQRIGPETLKAGTHTNGLYFLGVQPMVFQIKINRLAYLHGPPTGMSSSAR
jgi:hypothetical protein